MLDLFAKIISGGQNGADIAGVRAAKSLGIPTGGTLPKGWVTLDGPRPDYATLFGMVEHEKSGYPPRTEQNAADSDITLRIALNLCSAGEQCTMRACKKQKKEWLDFKLERHDGDLLMPSQTRIAEVAHHLLCLHEQLGRPLVLNIAGNSEKTARGIEVLAEKLVVDLLTTCKSNRQLL